MLRIASGALLALLTLVGAMPALAGPYADAKSALDALHAKALESASRRYVPIFSPDLELASVLKQAPEVTLSVATSLPTNVPVTLTADIRYISAAEIQKIEFLRDGVVIETTVPAQGYQKMHTFASAHAGARQLQVRVTDTDNVTTTSPAVAATLFVPELLGQVTGIVNEGNARYIEGWACAKSVGTPVDVELYFDGGPGVGSYYGAYPANAAVNGALTGVCGTGNGRGFRIPVTQTMALNHSNRRVHVRTALPSNGPSLMLAGSGSYYANRAPFVVLDATPSTVQVGQPVTFGAAISDPDGSSDVIASVSLYRGSQTLPAAVLASPYRHTWTPAAGDVGTIAWRAVVSDRFGVEASSDVSVQVAPRANVAPTLTVSSPAAGATIASGGSVTVAGSASDSDGTIARVEVRNAATNGLLLTVHSHELSAGAFSKPLSGLTATTDLQIRSIDNDETASAAVIRRVTVAPVGGGDPTVTIPAPDAVSDTVGATAGEFRVTESGAATYSIPLYAVPGTAGVTPQLSLTYTSQGGDGPLGQGWAIAGTSTISRCRASREAGDFVGDGSGLQDGGPITYTQSDRYCLDGQRLLEVAGTCPAVAGLQSKQYRTELESFQRVCAYSTASTDASPRFFSVERTDGSTSFYGDRDGWKTSATRADGYVETNAYGVAAGEAVSWAQTRFRDSAGNFIDYDYVETSSALGANEHLLGAVRYTGKIDLSSAGGETVVSQPYAAIRFEYEDRTDGAAVYYAAGARQKQSQRVLAISAYDAGGTMVRRYVPSYRAGTSGAQTLLMQSIQECTSADATTCLPPTQFGWSTAQARFSDGYANAQTSGQFKDLVSYRLGDVNGDGRQDLVWFKNVDIAGVCTKSQLFVAFGKLEAGSNALTLQPSTAAGVCTPRKIADIEDSWHLLDYDGDGRDDLFIAGADGGRWSLYLSNGAQFVTVAPGGLSADQLINVSIPVPGGNDSSHLAQVADLNGDGLLDVVYAVQENGARMLKARLMERVGAGWAWGAERYLRMRSGHGDAAFPRCDSEPNAQCRFSNLSKRAGNQQLNDFNGDGRSDLLLNVTVTRPSTDCPTSQQMTVIAGMTQTTSAGTLKAMAAPEPAPAAGAAPPPPTCQTLREAYTAAYVVDGVSGSDIVLRSYTAWIESDSTHDFPDRAYYRFGDVNADGLTDLVRRSTRSGSKWVYHLNSGRGFMQPQVLSAADIPNKDYLQLLDVTGDGRADVVYPSDSGNRPFVMRQAQRAGGFGAETAVPGGAINACFSGTCQLTTWMHVFGDFDGDASTDYLRIKTSPTAEGQGGDVYAARTDAASRYRPRDALTSITNGFGATTVIEYLPLTNKAVYRADAGTRNSADWGRGAPVQDMLAPTYVVAHASSSAPTFGDANAMSHIDYRYAGAKLQAGGRGYLGFREVTSFDTETGLDGGTTIATTTTYRQDYPYIGRPMTTVKRVVASHVSDACYDDVTDACFTPRTAYDVLPGAVISRAEQEWAVSPAFVETTQAPLHVRSVRSIDDTYDLTGVQTSRVVTTFATFDAYGNPTASLVATYDDEGSSYTPSSALATVETSNVYSNDTVAWRLGRLTSSTVTHRRRQPNGTFASKSRTSTFEYDMASSADASRGQTGWKTGFLVRETAQPSAGGSVELRTEYDLDAYGNRIAAYTCSADIAAGACRTTAIAFRPVGANGTLSTSVHRYAKTQYDARGRFVVSTTEPFHDGSTTVQRQTSTITGRDALGNVTRGYDINGRDALAVFGAFGRPYYSWSETVAGAAVGEDAKGVSSTTTYRWCGSGANRVSCPVGAAFREQVQAEGAATAWTYHDVLGRPLLKARQAFQTTANQGFSAVCTYFDTAGRGTRTSEPFFLASGGGATEPSFAGAPTPCATATYTTVRYDGLGRPAATVHPDGSYTIAFYSGRTVEYTDPNNHSRREVKNALGELVEAVDGVGSTATYTYDVFGNPESVTRNAGVGRGDIVTTFLYDDAGRKRQQTDPDTGTWTYVYNAAGELIQQTDANGNRVLNDVDARGRIWRSRAYAAGSSTPESTSTFTFDTASNAPGQLSTESIVQTEPTDDGSVAQVTMTRVYAYDALGRPSGRVTDMDDGRSYAETTEYDALGRPFNVQDATGRWARTEFNARGYAVRVCDSTQGATGGCPADRFHIQVEGADARGNVTRERRDNPLGPLTVREYDAVFGRLKTVRTGTETGATSDGRVQTDSYVFDSVGNLTTRSRASQLSGKVGLDGIETFRYDAADRLVKSWFGVGAEPVIDPNAAPASNLTSYAEYDKLGNFCRRMILGVWVDYGYAGRAGCGGTSNGVTLRGSGTTSAFGAHQVANLTYRVGGQALQPTVHPDANGNHTQVFGPALGDGTVNPKSNKWYRYTARNQAREIFTGESEFDRAKQVRFTYGSDGDRYKRRDKTAAAYAGSAPPDSTTYYLGNVERVVTDAGVVTWRRTIGGAVLQELNGDAAGGGYTTAGAVATTNYLYHDHQGSVTLWARVNGSNYTVAKYYDNAPFGEARGRNTAYVTGPGFTGHEHVDQLSVIHMNGRIYDPVLGRFLQADPMVQAPGVPQNWNPYAYAFNNPLRYTDPTGAMSVGEIVRTVVAIVISIYCPMLAPYVGGQLMAAMIGGFVAGVVQTGSLKGGVIGAFSAGVFHGIGSMGWAEGAGNGALNSGLTGSALAGKTLLHGMAGGVMSKLQGGKFGHGFFSAGVTQLASGAIDGIDPANAGVSAKRVFAAAVVGGTVSELTGGKFANGAVTAAFSRAFNDELHNTFAEDTYEDLVRSAGELFEPGLFPAIDASLAAGESAAQHWSDTAHETGNPLYHVPGAMSALWTRDTAGATAATLCPVGKPIAASAKLNGMLGSLFLRYPRLLRFMPQAGVRGTLEAGGWTAGTMRASTAARGGWSMQLLGRFRIQWSAAGGRHTGAYWKVSADAKPVSVPYGFSNYTPAKW